MFVQGDFLQWVDLSNDFNSCFGNHMMLRQDLQVQNDLLQSDPHFQDVVLHIIYVIRTTMYRCSGKYFYYAY